MDTVKTRETELVFAPAAVTVMVWSSPPRAAQSGATHFTSLVVSVLLRGRKLPEEDFQVKRMESPSAFRTVTRKVTLCWTRTLEADCVPSSNVRRRGFRSGGGGDVSSSSQPTARVSRSTAT